MSKEMTPEERREYERDLHVRNSIRSRDYAMLKELVWERRITMTERTRMQHLESCLSDIVAHYVLTEAEREEVQALLERPDQVPIQVNLIEEMLRAVYHVREHQERQHGGPDHDRKHSSRDWISFVVKQLAKAEVEPFDYYDFKAAMLETAAVAVAGAEWATRVIAHRRAVKEGLVKDYDEAHT